MEKTKYRKYIHNKNKKVQNKKRHNTETKEKTKKIEMKKTCVIWVYLYIINMCNVLIYVYEWVYEYI